MINLSSYFGLDDAKIRASDKDLPVEALWVVWNIIKQRTELKIHTILTFLHFWNGKLKLVSEFSSHLPKIELKTAKVEGWNFSSRIQISKMIYNYKLAFISYQHFAWRC